MKLFQTVQKILASMGFTPNQQRENVHREFNFRQNIFVVILAINAILLVFYIFLVANALDEYMDAIFSLTVVIGTEMAFISLICKNDDIFINIEFLEKQITESKCKFMTLYSVFDSEIKIY